MNAATGYQNILATIYKVQNLNSCIKGTYSYIMNKLNYGSNSYNYCINAI